MNIHVQGFSKRANRAYAALDNVNSHMLESLAQVHFASDALSVIEEGKALNGLISNYDLRFADGQMTAQQALASAGDDLDKIMQLRSSYKPFATLSLNRFLKHKDIDLPDYQLGIEDRIALGSDDRINSVTKVTNGDIFEPVSHYSASAIRRPENLTSDNLMELARFGLYAWENSIVNYRLFRSANKNRVPEPLRPAIEYSEALLGYESQMTEINRTLFPVSAVGPITRENKGTPVLTGVAYSAQK